jgi:hypothetical protein
MTKTIGFAIECILRRKLGAQAVSPPLWIDNVSQPSLYRGSEMAKPDLALLCLRSLSPSAFSTSAIGWCKSRSASSSSSVKGSPRTESLPPASMPAGATTRLAVESLPAVALLSNYSQDFAVPDEAAAATTLATGVKVNNRSLGRGPNDKRLRSLIDLARKKGRAIGVVTNGRLTDPSSPPSTATTRATSSGS